MTLKEVLEELKKTIEEEKELLLQGLKSKEEAGKLEIVEKKKVELLSKLSSFSEKELKPFKNEIEELQKLNEEVKVLIISNLNFIEEILSELFPQRNITYGNSKNNLSFFEKKL